MSESKPLYERTGRAAIWTVGGKLFAKTIDFFSLLILARFLGPAEFGLVAMAMTAVLVIEAVLELPLSAVLLNVAEPTDAMFDTAFTLGFLRSLVIFGLLGALSWPLSLFYHEPRLVMLLCVLGAAPAMRGLVSPRLVNFTRELDFRRDFILDVGGKLFSLIIAATIAVTTHSYWAIAIGTISTTAVMMITSYIFAPQRIRFTLSQWHIFVDMVGWNTATQMVAAVNWQLDKFLLPRFIDVAAFGRFSSANDLIAIPIQAVVQPVTRPLVAAFAAASRTGHGLDSIYLKASVGLFTAVAPILLTLALLSEPIVRVILGPKWLETASLMSVLAFIAIGSLPTVVMPALAMTLNQMRLTTLRTFFELAVKLPVTLIGILTLGLTGALIGRGVAMVAVLLVSMFVVRKLISLSIAAQFKSLLRPTIALVAMGVTYYFLDMVLLPMTAPLIIMLNLVWVGIAGGLVYVGTYFLTWHLAGRPDGVERLAERFVGKYLNKGARNV
jgi:O-antigen/teichoic acid export membrane protein